MFVSGRIYLSSVTFCESVPSHTFVCFIGVATSQVIGKIQQRCGGLFVHVPFPELARNQDQWNFGI